MLKNVFKRTIMDAQKDQEMLGFVKENAGKWFPYADTASVTMSTNVVSRKFQFRISGQAGDITGAMAKKAAGIICIEMDTEDCAIDLVDDTLVLTVPKKEDEIKDVCLGDGIKYVTNFDTDGMVAYLGENLDGGPALVDFSTEPHLLIGGTTGAGKTNALHDIVLSLCYKYTPDELEIYTVDILQNFGSVYEGEPHFIQNATDENAARDVIASVDKIVTERTGGASGGETGKGIPEHIFLIIEQGESIIGTRDGDQSVHKQLRDRIKHIATYGRKCGVHLIMTSQFPDNRNVDHAIMEEIGNRLALHVTRSTFSTQIIGVKGAERLGIGQAILNMLPKPNDPAGSTEKGSRNLDIIQCALTDPDERIAAVEALKDAYADTVTQA